MLLVCVLIYCFCLLTRIVAFVAFNLCDAILTASFITFCLQVTHQLKSLIEKTVNYSIQHYKENLYCLYSYDTVGKEVSFSLLRLHPEQHQLLFENDPL